jgi:hypothetical protein
MLHYSEAAVEWAIKVQEVILRTVVNKTLGFKKPRF